MINEKVYTLKFIYINISTIKIIHDGEYVWPYQQLLILILNAYTVHFLGQHNKMSRYAKLLFLGFLHCVKAETEKVVGLGHQSKF